MASPRKTLLIEHISYVEEGLQRIKEELRNLINEIDIEFQSIIQELELLETREGEVTEEIFTRINDLLEDAWTNAMSARNRLQELDEDFDNAEKLLKKSMVELKKTRKRETV